MRKERGFNSLLALVLCVALLLVGPGSPVTTFASLGEDDPENSETETEAYDDETGYDENDDENDESTYTGQTSSTSDKLDELYTERDKIQGSIEQLKSKEQEVQASIASTKNEKEKAIAQRNSLAYEISVRSELIAALEEKIRLLEEEIELRQVYIEEKQTEIGDKYQLLQKRLGAMYMQDDGTMLGLLIGSDSFAEFLTRGEYMVLIAEHDRNLMQDLTEQRIAIEAEKVALEEVKAQEEEDKASVEKEKQTLGVQHNEAAKQVQDIDSMEQEYLADLAKNKAMQEAAKVELNKVFQQIEWSKNPYSGGVMHWPLPGYSTISSVYGLRFSGNDFHTGMDITGSGCYGATIEAAADGVVKMANTAHAPGDGYGIYLIIDHGVGDDGKQVATVYAHCSALLVGIGQEVKRGEAIAKVGSTGWSTGPHLHFEVRINGTAVEPSQYLKG